MRESGQHHSPTALPLGKRSISHCAGGLLGPRDSLDVGGKTVSQGFDPWTVRSVTSLYTVYPAHSAKLAYYILQNRFYLALPHEIKIILVCEAVQSMCTCVLLSPSWISTIFDVDGMLFGSTLTSYFSVLEKY